MHTPAGLREYRSVPQPKEVPFIGSFHRRFRSPMSFFQELQRDHGDFARFTLFNERFLLCNHPSAINEFLVTKQQSFRKGRALEGARVFLGNSLLVSEGQEHAHQRKLIQPAFHRGRIAGYAQVMARRAQQWTDRRRDGEELDMAVEMNRLTLAVVGETMFGSEVDAEAGEIARSLTVIIESFNRMLLPLWRYWRYLPFGKNLRLRAAQRSLDTTIYRLIARRRQENRDHGDLLSMLLAAEDAEDVRRRLSDTEVRDQAMTIFLAGHETTATALAWTWHLLATHEPVRQKLQQEVTALLGPHRLPTLDDTTRLPYATAVFSEAIRLYPPVWVIGRRAMEDVVIGDIKVPARTIVLGSQYIVHRDARFWPRADEFLPERWLEDDSSKDRPKFAYFPFGGGARICIGDGFAWAEGVILLSVMARRWRFEVVPGHPIELNPSVTLRSKHGLMMIARSQL